MNKETNNISPDLRNAPEDQIRANIQAGALKDEYAGFWNTHGSRVITAGLAVYLVLLTIGTTAEVFDIEPILDWWFWRTPGKPPLGQ